jgi:hypothetical protein
MVHDTFVDRLTWNTRCDFFMRSLQLLNLDNLAQIFGLEVEMLIDTIRKAARGMLTGQKTEYRNRLQQVLMPAPAQG